MPSGFHYFNPMTCAPVGVFKERGTVPRFGLSLAGKLFVGRQRRVTF
jgi:hypothetical protein